MPPSDSLADRRRTAAAIFIDPRNGRMPRTLVNRMWHRLLGRGIVENPDEMDGEPWSPELLDWLASDFVEGGYDLKRLSRRSCLEAYQMRAVPRGGAAAWICVSGSRGQAAHRGAVRRCHRRDHGRLERVSAAGPPRAPHRRGPPPDATRVNGKRRRVRWHVRSAGRFATRFLDAQYGGDDDSGARAGQWRTTGELAASRRAQHARRVARAADGAVRDADQFARRSAATPPQSRTAPAPFDIDISGATRLWLIVQDANSTAVDKAEAVWARCRTRRTDGAITPLTAHAARRTSLRTALGPVVFDGSTFESGFASRYPRGLCTTSRVAASPGSAGCRLENTSRSRKAKQFLDGS